MRGVILKTVSKCTDTTTNTQYGHAAIFMNQGIDDQGQVKCSFLYCKLKLFIPLTI